MEIAAILLTAGITILVALYLSTPLLEQQGRRVTAEEHELSALFAERDRVVNALQELDFDFRLGKIPEEDYPVQRTALLQKGAEILRKIDSFSHQPDSAHDTEARIEKAVAARRADAKPQPQPLTDDDLESLIAARRKAHKNKSAGFCPKCGKPVLASDKFCPSCGTSLAAMPLKA
jgi:NADH pyrophosphatase NudC (nudix superfamily)